MGAPVSAKKKPTASVSTDEQQMNPDPPDEILQVMD
jgi:hypothetical protein